jgi:hypothetical protein
VSSKIGPIDQIAYQIIQFNHCEDNIVSIIGIEGGFVAPPLMTMVIPCIVAINCRQGAVSCVSPFLSEIGHSMANFLAVAAF